MLLKETFISPTFSCHFDYWKDSLQPLASEMFVSRLSSSPWLEFLHSQCFDKHMEGNETPECKLKVEFLYL